MHDSNSKKNKQGILNPWLNDLTPKGRQQVEFELDRQRRTLKRIIARKIHQQTARKIIQRSQKRINWIIADELAGKGKAHEAG